MYFVEEGVMGYIHFLAAKPLIVYIKALDGRCKILYPYATVM